MIVAGLGYLLTPPPLVPVSGEKQVVFLSAGHATSDDNRGNVGVHGQREEETTLELALDLAQRLLATGRFEVVLARGPGERPSFDQRLAHAERVGAAVLVELHSDVRGDLFAWARRPDGEVAWRTRDEKGFSVLYNDRTTLPTERERLATVIAESLSVTGFPAYPGCHYEGLYEPHDTPGVYRDRRGLRMLRASAMPSIIVETHNATDFDESLWFRDESHRAALGQALAVGLTRYFWGD